MTHTQTKEIHAHERPTSTIYRVSSRILVLQLSYITISLHHTRLHYKDKHTPFIHFFFNTYTPWNWLYSNFCSSIMAVVIPPTLRQSPMNCIGFVHVCSCVGMETGMALWCVYFIFHPCPQGTTVRKAWHRPLPRSTTSGLPSRFQPARALLSNLYVSGSSQ